MTDLTRLIRQPLLAGFSAGLALALAACSVANNDAEKKAAAKPAEPQARQEVLHEEVESDAFYLAPDKIKAEAASVAGTVEARKMLPQSPPMVAPAPMTDSAAPGYQDVY
ncbi:MAG TPA: hypothetical protein VLC30_18410, partial [Pseudomonas sp.]|nr:hypothetical protein [Pseudomonas sp.]